MLFPSSLTVKHASFLGHTILDARIAQLRPGTTAANTAVETLTLVIV